MLLLASNTDFSVDLYILILDIYCSGIELSFYDCNECNCILLVRHILEVCPFVAFYFSNFDSVLICGKQIILMFFYFNCHCYHKCQNYNKYTNYHSYNNCHNYHINQTQQLSTANNC